MKRSFLELIGSTVVPIWIIGFGIVFLYSRTRNWTEEHAREQGIFWAYRTADLATPDERENLVAEMASHHGVPITVVPLADVRRATGAVPTGGERYFDRRDHRAQWLYIPFHDERGAFAAGPVDPVSPKKHFPIGAILAIFITPLVASIVAMRLATQLRKVEQASAALGSGVLSARVDNHDGPTRELAASFNEMAERVERLVKDREELVQAVSHELGSPLSRLQFHLELLANARDPDQHDQRVEAMAGEIDELHELVAELLRWVQSDKTALKRTHFDAVKPLADLADLAELHLPDERAVSVSVALPETLTVNADPRLFQRAIENLLRNAVHYAEGQVTLSIREVDDIVHVMVDDDGPGIVPEERDRVLAPFVRIDADRDRDTGGVGLGLAIVSRIVRHHGGTITIDDGPLGGARITTSWPLASSAVETDREPTGELGSAISADHIG